MAIYYLDVDDEITSAAARIRGSLDARIALVLPGGSRVATSRINFKLLEREAKQRGKQLAIVAPDASVRSLASSAGMPVYATVREYEAAEAAEASRPKRPARPVPGDVSEALGELAATLEPTAAAPPAGRRRGSIRDGSAGARGRSSGSNGQSDAGGPPARRRRRLGLSSVLLISLLAVVVAVGSYGAYLFWPSATIVLTVDEKPLGPLALTVKIDPAAVAVNDSTLTVPGTSKSFDVKASDTFTATGQLVVETVATGRVTFTSKNTVFAVPVLAGTQLSTASGVAFTTTATVSVPVANFDTGTPGTAEAPVVAVKKGLTGNVAAGAIVRLPSDLVAAKVTVANAAATTGGTHTVTPLVQQADIDKAKAGLTKSLGTNFAATLADPGSLPAGVQLFAGTGQLGPVAFDPDPATLLGQKVGSFQLAGETTGTATVADTGNVRGVAERRIASRVQAGSTLVDGSLTTALGAPTVAGAVVSMPVTAGAAEAATVDVGELKANIRGKSVDEARAYLSQFGTVTISVSPWWASRVSDYDFRIDLAVVSPSAHPGASVPAGMTASPSKPASSGATSTPGVSGSPGPSPSGSASPSASASSSVSESPSAEPTPTPGPSAWASPSASAT